MAGTKKGKQRKQTKRKTLVTLEANYVQMYLHSRVT